MIYGALLALLATIALARVAKRREQPAPVRIRVRDRR